MAKLIARVTVPSGIDIGGKGADIWERLEFTVRANKLKSYTMMVTDTDSKTSCTFYTTGYMVHMLIGVNDQIVKRDIVMRGGRFSSIARARQVLQEYIDNMAAI